jgi:hypothetical protein
MQDGVKTLLVLTGLPGSSTFSHLSRDTVTRAFTPECVLPAHSRLGGGRFDEQVAKGRRVGDPCRLQKCRVGIYCRGNASVNEVLPSV